MFCNGGGWFYVIIILWAKPIKSVLGGLRENTFQRNFTFLYNHQLFTNSGKTIFVMLQIMCANSDPRVPAGLNCSLLATMDSFQISKLFGNIKVRTTRAHTTRAHTVIWGPRDQYPHQLRLEHHHRQ